MPDRLDPLPTPLRLTPAADGLALLAHPDALLEHPGLSPAEKRAVLAGWISDARAVPGQPALRQLDSGAIADVDTLLAALAALDGPPGGSAPRPPTPRRPRGRTIRNRACSRGRIWGLEQEENDDPPPCPAAAALPLPRPQLEGGAAVALPEATAA